MTRASVMTDADILALQLNLLGEHGWMLHRKAAHMHRMFGHHPKMRSARWDFISHPDPDVEALNLSAWRAELPEEMPMRFAGLVAIWEAMEAEAKAHPEESGPGPGWANA